LRCGTRSKAAHSLRRCCVARPAAGALWRGRGDTPPEAGSDDAATEQAAEQAAFIIVWAAARGGGRLERLDKGNDMLEPELRARGMIDLGTFLVHGRVVGVVSVEFVAGARASGGRAQRER